MNSIFIESVGARLTNRSYIRVYHSRLQLRTNKLLNYSVVPEGKVIIFIIFKL